MPERNVTPETDVFIRVNRQIGEGAVLTTAERTALQILGRARQYLDTRAQYGDDYILEREKHDAGQSTRAFDPAIANA